MIFKEKGITLINLIISIILILILSISIYFFIKRNNSEITNNQERLETNTIANSNTIAENQNYSEEDNSIEYPNHREYFLKLANLEKYKIILLSVAELGEFSDSSELKEEKYLYAIERALNMNKLGATKDTYLAEEINEIIDCMFGIKIKNYPNSSLLTYDNGNYNFIQAMGEPVATPENLVITNKGNTITINYDLYYYGVSDDVEKKGSYVANFAKTENGVKILSNIKTSKSDNIVYEYQQYYVCHIPQININSSDVARINNEIKENYAIINKENEYEEPFIKYDAFINNEILSLIIYKNYPYDYVKYETYNINIKTGKEVSNKELIKINNITEEQFLDKTEELYENCFEKLYAEFENGDYKELFQEQYESTILLENRDINSKMFLNENGKICVIAKIYSLIGAEAYYHILPID